jgi:hypothetical protein
MPSIVAASASEAALSTAKASEHDARATECTNPKRSDANPRRWPKRQRFRRGSAPLKVGAAGCEVVPGHNASPRAPSSQPGIRASRGAHARTAREQEPLARVLARRHARFAARRTRLCRAPESCSSAASPCERTPYCRPSRAASQSPFSRISGGPPAHTSLRERSSSAASSLRARF